MNILHHIRITKTSTMFHFINVIHKFVSKCCYNEIIIRVENYSIVR